MTTHRCALASVAAILLVGSLGLADASAFGPRRAYVAPYSAYYAYPAYGYSYSPYYYNPYVLPLPGFGILPLPLASSNYAYGYDYPYGIRRTSEVYGYPVDPLAVPPRMRSSLYPAVPYERSPEVVAGDERRVRFEITVPHANATIAFDGAKTKQTGLNRVFMTPPMDEGKEYSVTITAQWRNADGTLSLPQEKTFKAKAGQTIKHTFVD